jgi:integrase
MNRSKNNPENDRAKRDYLVWLKEAKQRSATTVEQARHAIDRFETYTGFKDFGSFNKEVAIAFKRRLSAATGERTGKPLSIASIHHALLAVRDFLAWLSGQPGYRRRVRMSDVAYLNLTTGEERQARATRPKQYASVEDYVTAISAMPTITEVQRRDRAILAFMLLTGMRDAAVVTLKLGHVDVARYRVFQDPRQVKTKFRKAIETVFFPVGDDLVAIVTDWVNFLIGGKGWGPDDPLFPKTSVGQDNSKNFAAQGLSRDHWASAKPVRDIFRSAFARVGLPYVNPHTVRDTLTQLAYKLELSPEQFKAWSQNMGHDKPLTTLNSYGHVSSERQSEIILGLANKKSELTSDDAMAERIAEKVAARIGARAG